MKTSNVLIAVFGIIAIASMCMAGYALVQLNGSQDSSDSGPEIFDADAYYERIQGYAAQIREQTDIVPEVAIVLGSGLGSFIEGVDVHTVIPYASMEGFPVSTVPGHAGKFVLGTLGGKNIIVMQGRVHYYEGYPSTEVVLPLRVMHELGAKTIILTNAVGSLNYDYEPGTFMVVKDHISMVPSPLIGENVDSMGERFFPMNGAYDTLLRETLKKIADEKGITLHGGRYIQVTGPQYETPAEIELYRSWGCDTVGMSSAIEAIAARHCSMKVCTINCLTNWGAGMGGYVPSHEEVQEMCEKMAGDLIVMLNELMPRIRSGIRSDRGSRGRRAAVRQVRDVRSHTFLKNLAIRMSIRTQKATPIRFSIGYGRSPMS